MASGTIFHVGRGRARIASFASISVLACVMTHAAAAQQAAIAFTHVNVVPMDRERVLENQTVVVVGGRIATIGAADEVTLPEDATTIDGQGKYLAPGLVDMHVHLKSRFEFPLYLANGVTTVFNLWGFPVHLKWRDEIAAGKRLGPTIYTTCPIIFEADDAEASRKFVDEQFRAGYDGVKIYNNVKKSAYPTIVATAREHKMLVVGHIPREPGLEGVLAEHQAIAHVEEYIYTFFHDRVDDTSRIPDAVRMTREANVPVILTLVNFEHIIRQVESLPALLARPEMSSLTPWIREAWSPELNFYHATVKGPEKLAYFKQALEFQKTLTLALHRGGVRVLVGTDAMNPGVPAGYSVHEELKMMVDLGLTPFEALRAATRYPAEFLRPTAEFGVVAEGKRADLLLVDGNPLEDVARVARPAGVMVRGRWLPADELKRRLADVPRRCAREQRSIEELLTTDPLAAGRRLLRDDPFYDLTYSAAAHVTVDRGVDAFKRLYHRGKQAAPDSVLVSEGFVNELGARLLRTDHLPESIALLQMNVDEHPQLANAYDTLAEAHLRAGHKDEALKLCRQALEINPTLPNSLAMMKALAPSGPTTADDSKSE